MPTFVIAGNLLPLTVTIVLYTPQRGVADFSGKNTFAVGKPSLLPRCFPLVTVPFK